MDSRRGLQIGKASQHRIRLGCVCVIKVQQLLQFGLVAGCKVDALRRIVLDIEEPDRDIALQMLVVDRTDRIWARVGDIRLARVSWDRLRSKDRRPVRVAPPWCPLPDTFGARALPRGPPRVRNQQLEVPQS